MQCPRCHEEVTDRMTACPVCQKPLSDQTRSNLRVALNGEAYESEPLPIYPPAQATPHPSPFQTASPAPAETPAPPALRLIPSNPDRFPGKRSALRPVRSSRLRSDLRWSIVAFALLGAIASAVLWRYPYVAPVHINLSPAGLPMADDGRPIPAIYLWLWGTYGILAVAVQFFLPAPWRMGPMQIRTNWVLNVTTVVTVLLFLGAGAGQGAEGMFGRETTTYQESGGYEYTSGSGVRSVTQQEAQEISAQLVRNQERAIFKQWNMAALLSFLALGGYAVWWLVEQPVADPVTPALDPGRLLRKALRMNRSEETPEAIETVPSENVRSREPAPGNISWR